MLSRRLLSSLLVLAAAIASLSAMAQAPAPAPQAEPSTMTLRAETRLVLVDTIVTDKKGVYVHDLTQKDFHVYEDGKEQSIKSFSFEADPALPESSKPHYLVLFFDNSSMDISNQAQARQAALKFIDSNAGANRYMAIVNFGGTMRVAQNFTPDADRLKKVVSGINVSTVTSNPELSSISSPLSSAELDFGQRTVLLALSSMAKMLTTIPGRKILVFLSSGFVLTPDILPDLTTAIDACNKANVAVYPIDVRGLAPPKLGALPHNSPSDSRLTPQSAFRLATDSRSTSAPVLREASFILPEPSVAFQKGGTGGGGSRPGGGGSRPVSPGGGGSRPGGVQPMPGNVGMMNRAPSIVPHFPTSASDNQQVLYTLAEGTGGFVILNTNDLVGGMEKIAAEQNQYYVLGYTPEASSQGSCHTLKVKVNRGDTIVRSRSGYCNVKPVDLLAGNPVETQLESEANGAKAGTFQSSITAPFFYTGPNVARVDVTMEIPADAMKVEKHDGKYHATVNILGVVVDKRDNVVARFSDTAKLDFESKGDLEHFSKQPYHYEKQFEVPSGDFRLKAVFSSGGESFGKAETPLQIDLNDGKQFTLSGIALSNTVIKLNDVTADAEFSLLEDRTPLLVNHMEIVPSGTNSFKKTELAVLYVEVYEPLLKGDKPPAVALGYRVVDRKSGAVKFDSGLMNMAPSIRPGNPVIPVGLKLVTDKLDPGDYRLEVQATDSAGLWSLIRTADFNLE